MNYMCVCVNFNSITLPSNKCNLHQYYQFYLHQVCLGQTFLYQTYFYQTCLYHVLPRYQIYLCQTYLHQTALFQIYPCQTYRLSKLPLYQTYLISPSNLPLSICLCQTYLKLISLPNLLSLYYITYRYIYFRRNKKGTKRGKWDTVSRQGRHTEKVMMGQNIFLCKNWKPHLLVIAIWGKKKQTSANARSA